MHQQGYVYLCGSECCTEVSFSLASVMDGRNVDAGVLSALLLGKEEFLSRRVVDCILCGAFNGGYEVVMFNGRLWIG